MPPRDRTLRPDMHWCKTCNTPLWERRDENFHKSEYYCDGCIGEARKKDPYNYVNTGWTPFRGTTRVYGDDGSDEEETRVLSPSDALKELRKSISEIPKGNLPEAEYRFWSGVPDVISLRAVCRGCQEIVHGDEEERIAHKQRTEEYNGNPCTVALTNAYRRMLKKGKCAVCSGFTTLSRYGVPLCSTRCVEKWKFCGQEEFMGLALELMQERAKPQIQENGG